MPKVVQWDHKVSYTIFLKGKTDKNRSVGKGGGGYNSNENTRE
jgi:hypothetical protein